MEPDLRDLLAAWMGGEPDPETGRCERLLARLRDDAAFRREFVDEIWMLGKLKAVQSSEPRWLRLEDELGWSALRPADLDGSAVEEAIARRLAEADQVPTPPRPVVPRRWGRRLVVAASSLAAAVMVGLIALRPGRGPRESAPTFPPASVPGRPPNDGVAMVLRQEEARWSPDGLAPAPGGVLGAGRLQLLGGRVTLSMLNGVRIVVEGPADFDLISVDRVYCRRGRLRARVPEGAEGFVVSGPGSAVVDMGTEFAVNLSPDGAARGRVFRGRVEASVIGAAGTPERSRVLSESRSFEINRSVVELEDEDEPTGGFAGPSGLAAADLAVSVAYPQAVLDDRPAGYWRFDRLDAGRVPNEVAGGPDLLAHGPVRLAGPAHGDGNRCAEFVADDTNQYFTPAGLWSPPDRPGYAVELWFLSEWIAHAALAGLVTEPDTHHHSFLLELTSRNRLTLHKPASVRILHRLPPGPSGGDTAFSEPYYVPYRWHHLVGQMNGDQLEVYLDGLPTPPLKVAPGHVTPPGQLIFGRLTTIPIHDPGRSRPFCGRMDETAIYDHPLPPDRIRLHHDLGRGGRP